MASLKLQYIQNRGILIKGANQNKPTESRRKEKQRQQQQTSRVQDTIKACIYSSRLLILWRGEEVQNSLQFPTVQYRGLRQIKKAPPSCGSPVLWKVPFFKSHVWQAILLHAFAWSISGIFVSVSFWSSFQVIQLHLAVVFFQTQT